MPGSCRLRCVCLRPLWPAACQGRPPAASPPTCRRPCSLSAPAVVLDGAGDASVGGQGHMTFLHSDHPEDENSFEQPTKASLHVHALCPLCPRPSLLGCWGERPSVRRSRAGAQRGRPAATPLGCAPQVASKSAGVDGLGSKFVLTLEASAALRCCARRPSSFLHLQFCPARLPSAACSLCPAGRSRPSRLPAAHAPPIAPLPCSPGASTSWR